MSENKKSDLFEKYNTRFANGYCAKEQLEKIVELNLLSYEEYKEITGEEFNNVV